MSIEHAQDRPVAPIAAPGRPYREPPSWLIVALAAAYVVALAALVFLPGDTLLNRLRALDGGICAQNPLHSFFPAGQQLPLCSRNTGIYIGFASTFLTLAALGRLRAAQFPARRVLLVLGVAVLFMAEDGFNSLFLDLGLPHLYQPHNLLRLASGLGTGVAMCAVLLPVANTLTWRDEDDRASFGSLRELAAMLPMLILVFLAVGSQTAPLLYPVALLSSAGLVMALTLVNLVFVLGIGNKVGRFATWRQLVPAFTLIVVLAVIELTLLFHLKLAALSALHAP
jgi:uncharacterized membrane protein